MYRQDPVTWPMDGIVQPPLATAADWKNYRVPDAAAPWRWRGFREVMRMSRENGMGVVGNVRGPYSAAWMLFGMEAFSLLMYDEPELVTRVLNALTDYAVTAFGIMKAEGVDAILFSDDYGASDQPLFSLNHFRQFFAPQIQRLSDAASRLNLPLIMHSDGHIRPFVADAVDRGIRGLHPIERAAGMDLAEIKQAYGKRICLFGNVDNKYLLATGTPEEVGRQVKACIRIAGKGGGYCLGSDHSVHDGIPNRNVFALYEAGRRYGRYPLTDET
jgi:uroporphyrinogen decarboxylase